LIPGHVGLIQKKACEGVAAIATESTAASAMRFSFFLRGLGTGKKYGIGLFLSISNVFVTRSISAKNGRCLASVLHIEKTVT
jgi:hypothetical protein